jgi:threonine aldolase
MLWWSKQDPKEFGQLFDTISVCLSKGLWHNGFCLLADKATIHRALRIRKILGEVCVKSGIWLQLEFMH